MAGAYQVGGGGHSWAWPPSPLPPPPSRTPPRHTYPAPQCIPTQNFHHLCLATHTPFHGNTVHMSMQHALVLLRLPPRVTPPPPLAAAAGSSGGWCRSTAAALWKRPPLMRRSYCCRCLSRKEPWTWTSWQQARVRRVRACLKGGRWRWRCWWLTVCTPHHTTPPIQQCKCRCGVAWVDTGLQLGGICGARPGKFPPPFLPGLVLQPPS